MSEVLFGFELALPPDRYHEWNDYIPFIPSDKDLPLQTIQEADFEVKNG